MEWNGTPAPCRSCENMMECPECKQVTYRQIGEERYGPLPELGLKRAWVRDRKCDQCGHTGLTIEAPESEMEREFPGFADFIRSKRRAS